MEETARKEENVMKYYRCDSNHHNCITDTPGTKCLGQGTFGTTCLMVTEMQFVAPPVSEMKNEAPKPGNGGYVKGVVTYTVMDNLVVTPMSTISIITLLNKLNVHDITSLEEKVVEVGMNEALELLKVSLRSETVLTDVFVRTTNCNVN